MFNGRTFTPSTNRAWNYARIRMAKDRSMFEASMQTQLITSGADLSASGGMIIQLFDPGTFGLTQDRTINMIGMVKFMRIASDGTPSIATIEDTYLTFLADGGARIGFWLDKTLASYARITIQIPKAVRTLA